MNKLSRRMIGKKYKKRTNRSKKKMKVVSVSETGSYRGYKYVITYNDQIRVRKEVSRAKVNVFVMGCNFTDDYLCGYVKLKPDDVFEDIDDFASLDIDISFFGLKYDYDKKRFGKGEYIGFYEDPYETNYIAVRKGIRKIIDRLYEIKN